MSCRANATAARRRRLAKIRRITVIGVSAVVEHLAEQLIDYLRTEVISAFNVTASVESVEVIRADHFRQHEIKLENSMAVH